MKQLKARTKDGNQGARARSVGALTKYPFRGKTIELKDAIEIIADVLYPCDNKREARKRVRNRILYQQRLKKVPQSQPLVAGEFFAAVLDLFEDWSPLRLIQGLPVNTAVSVTGVASKSEVGRVRVIVDSPPLDDLPREYQRICWELEDCKEEILALKKKLAEVEGLLEERRERDRQISSARSKAGKLKGRRR